MIKKYSASISKLDSGNSTPFIIKITYITAIIENTDIPPEIIIELRLGLLLSSYANPFIYTLPCLNDIMVLDTSNLVKIIRITKATH